MSSAREARRTRNREDFLRATRQGLMDAGHTKQLSTAGVNAGNTYQEHLEDEIRKAVRVYHRLTAEALKIEQDDPEKNSWGPEGVEHKRKAARGLIRGLCKALLIYENSYEKDNKSMLMKIEKEFLNG